MNQPRLVLNYFFIENFRGTKHLGTFDTEANTIIMTMFLLGDPQIYESKVEVLIYEHVVRLYVFVNTLFFFMH